VCSRRLTACLVLVCGLLSGVCAGAGCPAPGFPPEFEAAVFADATQFEYLLVPLSGGAPRGTAVMGVAPSRRQGRDTLRFVYEVDVTEGHPANRGRTVVHTAADSLLPLIASGELEVEAGTLQRVRLETVYEGTRALVRTYPHGREKVVVRRLPRRYLDFHQLALTLRGLDLRPGARFDLVTFSSRVGAVLDTRVEVTGVETVTVPAGTFECHAVRVTVGSSVHRGWYTRDRERWLVQYDNRRYLFQLRRAPGEGDGRVGG